MSQWELCFLSQNLRDAICDWYPPLKCHAYAKGLLLAYNSRLGFVELELKLARIRQIARPLRKKDYTKQNPLPVAHQRRVVSSDARNVDST